MKLPIPDRRKIDLGKPVYTLDVNLVALKQPWELPQLDGLAELEFSYFRDQSVELCVTPQTTGEIMAGTALSELGSTALARVRKSEWFKARPPGSTIYFDDSQANEVFVDLRWTLWPTVTDECISTNQLNDVAQVYFHLIGTGGAHAATFLTNDGNFHRHAGPLQDRFGIRVSTPTDAWSACRSEYGLHEPTSGEIQDLWMDEGEYLRFLESLQTGTGH